MSETSTTWKSLAAGFLLGVVSTGLYALGFKIGGAFVWGASVLYIGYVAYEARHPEGSATRLGVLIGLLVGGAGALPAQNTATCAAYPDPRIWLEAHAWWAQDSLRLPTQVGQHLHLGMCWPVARDGGDAVTTDSTLHVDIRILLHNFPGTTNSVRVSDASTVKQSKPLVMGGVDSIRVVPFDVNLRAFGTGRREFRWTANIPKNQFGKRQYQSTGWQLCVRACTPTYRSGPWTEGRGWYEGPGYQNARFLSKLPYAPVAGDWTFTVKLVQKGAGGVYIDPNFHAGLPGIQIAKGGYAGPLTIHTTTLTNGLHRLVLLSSNGQSAGLLVIEFTVANP